MKKLTHIEGIAAPLPTINVDTDKIIPAMYMKTTLRTGMGKGLFAGLRYRSDGSENPEFILNKPAYRNTQILIAGENFGCGSSREHAAWALMDFGIQCVVAPSFADIFHNNCFNAGMLAIVLPQNTIDELMTEAGNGANARFSVDIAAQTITSPEGRVFLFELDPSRKHCLLNGLSDIGLTLQQSDAIGSFEQRHFNNQPWLAIG